MPVSLGRQLKAGRILLDAKLPKMARVLQRSVDTLRRAEADRPNARLVALAMRDLLSRNGVEFIVDGVRLAPPEAPAASDAQRSGPQ